MTRIAAVLWSGTVGGAETFTTDLCRTMREFGAEVGIVFVTRSDPLVSRIDAAGIPHVSLGLRRGRDVVRHPRALASAVEKFGSDGSLLPNGGYLAAALRLGGYGARVVGVIHDASQFWPMTFRDRILRPIDRATGVWATDIDVAVSDFVLSQINSQARRSRLSRLRPGEKRVIRIHNGVDFDRYKASPETHNEETVVIGYAGRLIEGKGVDVLIRAFAAGAAREGAQLRIAGDGPTRPMLEGLREALSLNHAVEFTGWTYDISSFWRGCHVAVMPSDRFVESFGMAAVEAMACARPVVVTANGALPELVEDTVTGFVVPPHDVRALGDVLLALARDAATRRAVGTAARMRCEQRFDIRQCAAAYLDLFENNRDN